MAIRRKAKEKFYQNNKTPGFDEKAKEVYNDYINFKDNIKDEKKKGFFASIFSASERYISSIANYDPDQLAKLDANERLFEMQILSDTRRSAHNSLVSKVSSTNRLFSLEGIKNLFGINTKDRNQVADYASKLVMGEYLTNERSKE